MASKEVQLTTAASDGDLAKVTQLLDEGVNVNAKTGRDKQTALMLASVKKHIPVIELLLGREGIDINAQDKNGTTALAIVASKGFSDIVKLLVERGANPNIQDNYKSSVLVTAVVRIDKDTVELLLNHGANPNLRTAGNATPLMFTPMNMSDLTPIARLLLDKGADPNAKDERGQTTLMGASKKGNPNLIKLLLERGADKTIKDNAGKTALDYAKTPEIGALFDDPADKGKRLIDAAMYGVLETVKKLLDEGVDVNSKDRYGETALIKASGSLVGMNVFNLLIERGADVNIVSSDRGDSALSIASGNNQLDKVRILLEKGANPNVTPTNGLSPLINASSKGYTDLARLLLDNGADPNLANGNYTPIIAAAGTGRTEIVKLLLDKGANPNTTGALGYTPITFAVEGGYVEVIRVLLEKGADPNAKNGFDQTPLSWAASKNNADLIKLLLEKGADKTIVDRYGKTAREYATKPEIINMFKDPEDIAPYKGKTADDISIFDIFLGKVDATTTEEQAQAIIRNFSLCPVCLSLEERGSEHGTGCMYKYHICKPELRHEELYNLYKDDRGYIYWCTYCGRICDSHFHYKLALVSDPKPTTVLPRDKPGSFFAFTCDNSDPRDIEGYRRDIDGVPVQVPPAKTNGGGGLGEKLNRLTRLIDYAFELQHATGEITNEEAKKELIEETWNAPMFRSRFDPRKLQKWKTDLSVFKPSAPPAPAAEVPEAVPAEGVIEDPNIEDGEDFITLADGLVIQFKHKDAKGELNDHVYGAGAAAEKHFISKDSLITYIRSMGEAKGVCFDKDECGGLLWPQEIAKAFEDPRLEVTEDDKKALASYKEKFNRDRAPVAGGAVPELWKFNFISRMEDDSCMLPPKEELRKLKKKAGNRTRKNKKRAKKTRRNK